METTNYFDVLRQKLSGLIREKPEKMALDDQELREREYATERYFKENEAHFIEYGNDCVDTSVKANADVRAVQKECYSVYKEEAPANYSKKEDWQSKVVIPKPFGSVQTAMSAVRKAFAPNFLSIDNENNPVAAEFWEKYMIHQLNEDHANFSIKFTDATGMGFAVGQSLEMIPTWRPGKGLDYILVEPWKIHRDPDATTRESQSGMYWIHQEYLDLYLLKELERTGKYSRVDKAGDSSPQPKDENLTQEEIAKRKNKVYQRSKFRKALLTSEFWGTILDSKGNLLLPNATYTWANDVVIEKPRTTPYETLRWPGTSFSPIPDFLAYEGRGLLHGIRSLWAFICSVLCLYNDNLNWVVNPMTEVELTALVDQDDIDTYPGKQYLTRGSMQGHQVVRTVDRAAKTTDVLSIAKYYEELFDSGTFVTHALKGQVEKREITAREAAQHLEQSMGVFGLMGENIEHGAIQAIKAGRETVVINAGYKDIEEKFGKDPEAGAPAFIDLNSETGVTLPEFNGSFHVSGLSAILKDNETMRNIREIILPLMVEGHPLARYVIPYKVLKSIETRVNLRDEGIVVSEDDAKRIDAEEKQRQDMIAQAQAEAVRMESEEKSQLHAEKMSKIDKEKENLDVKLVSELNKEKESKEKPKEKKKNAA